MTTQQTESQTANPSPPSAGMRLVARSITTPIVLCVLVIACATIGGNVSAITADATVIGLITMTMVVSLYVFVGNSGIFSFGHSVFMLTGAYATGVLVIPVVNKRALLNLPGWLERHQVATIPALLAAVAFSMLVAAVVAVPLSRMSALAAGLGTFAVLNIGYNLASNWTAVTGGPTGLAGVPTTTTVTTATLTAILAIVVAWLFQETALCLRLRATREDEIAARSIGIKVTPERATALVVSAGIGAMAGGTYALYVGSFTPDAFFLAITFNMCAMLVVGGRASLTGAVFGSVILTVLTYGLTKLESGFHIGAINVGPRPGLEEFGIALVTLACLIRRPRGLTGGREVSEFFARFRPREIDPFARALDVQMSEPHLPQIPVTMGTAGSDEAELLVAGASVRFGGLNALTDVTVNIRRGEILGLIGANGAGKTTLLNVLTGYQVLTSGTVTLDGHPITGITAEARARRGVIRSFQGARLFSRMTVAENVEAACVARGASRRSARQEAAVLLHRFGLESLADVMAEVLTHGQQRLLGVVRALAAKPSYLLLDEPAAGLNESETDELAELLRPLPQEFGLGLLIVEHDMRLIFGLCDRVHALAGGRTIADGPPEMVRSEPEVIRGYLGGSDA